MSLRESILNHEFEYPRGFDDPFGRERAKILEPVRRHLHNQSPVISRFTYSETAYLKHQNPFVSKILKALNKSGIRGYSLHCGKALSIRYFGPSLQYEEVHSEEVLEIRNKEGFRLQFRIIEKTAFGPALHILFLIRETSQQGSFFAIKRMLVGELWEKVFEPMGFAYLFGRAVWSSNSEIRHSGKGCEDWRKVLRYVGLDEDLEPILIPSLRLFYHRLGFIQFSSLQRDVGDDYVALLSRSVAKKIRESSGENVWNELTRFHLSNAKTWRETVSQRESRLSDQEIQKRILAKRVKLTQKSL
jgi:hypothetical protein